MSGFVMKALNVVWKGCVGVGMLAAAAAFALYYYQEKILYIPNPSQEMSKLTKGNQRGYRSPSEYFRNGRYSGGRDGDVIPFEEAHITTPDGVKVHVWLMYHPLSPGQKPLPTLIYFHGNAGNMGYRLPNAARFYSDVGINVLMMDYRGYGESTGEPSENGIIMDAESVLEYAKSHPLLVNSPIILFGRSLGGAVSLALYDRKGEGVSSLILENTFLSISDMVDALMPFLNYVRALKSMLLMMDWNNARSIAKVNVPILFVAGALDEIVPPSHMQKLYDLALLSRKREFYRILGGHHNDCYEAPGYYQKFKDHLLEIGLFETLAATKMPTNVSQLSCSTSDGDVSPAACASQKIESSDDDFDKITHEDVAAVAEQFAIPSVNTKN